jgi:peptidyl-prolyl isomerase G (cyclophilin G)
MCCTSSKKNSSGSAGHVDSEAEEGEVADDGELHPLVTVTNINPDEIPDVPPNRFLYRGERQTSINNRSKMDRNPRERERRHRSRIRGITKSGRVIKGRGVFVSVTWSSVLVLHFCNCHTKSNDLCY